MLNGSFKMLLNMDNPKASTRIWELDLLRVLAVLGMLYFHWFYLLDYWNLQNADLFSGNWDIFGDAIRNTFFVVVGAGMTISYQKNVVKNKGLWLFGFKSMKRGLILLGIGAVITLLSFLFSPEEPIRFGVLSFIGAALILLWPLMFRWYYLFGFTVIILLLEHFDPWQQESLLAYILGFYPYYWPSLDYFPLVPWLASVSAGALAGNVLFKAGGRRYAFIEEPQRLKPVLWIGKRALILYLLHMPVLALLIKSLILLGWY